MYLNRRKFIKTDYTIKSPEIDLDHGGRGGWPFHSPVITYA